MKINRHHLQGVAIGLALIAAIPLVAFAARTAAPVLTGLFTSNTLSITLPTPSISLGNATTTGSLYSATLYFSVTALDGVGETLPSPIVASSTPDNAHGYNVSWTPVVGAVGYRVYFSTSTPQGFTQYFTATTTNQYTFTSTSSPVFIPAGINATNSAYVANLSYNGNSWLNGGALAIGTTTFPANVLFQMGTTTATSTALIGAKGASGGRLIMVDSNGTHTTCSEITTNAGTVTGKVVTCP